MDRISELGRQATATDKSKLTLLELVLEMYARGLGFLKLDLYTAQAPKFTVMEHGLMPPLCSIQGLGVNAAQGIALARSQGKFTTVEDFRNRTNVNKTVVELLKANHILDGLPETDQMSLFDDMGWF
jgi:DNA polymerase-3 subunit alpha (Gram-positive type)